MAGAEPGAEGGGEGGGGRAPSARSGSAVRVAPLGPEQLRRVLEQVTKAQPPAEPPPPFVLQDAVRRLRDAAQQAALQSGPGAEPPRPPRLLPPQQLEAICVKVTSGETKGQERLLPQLAAIQPRTARLSQLPRRHCSVLALSVAGPQLPGAQPLLGTQPRPPVQVFVQRPLPTLRPVPAKGAVAPEAPDGPGATLAPRSASDPPAITPASSSSANLLISNLHTKHTEKLKKSLKVKTRSGRISRPPKYKAKDYRFIKTEDLADGHLSDSDDYAELSAEDEEERRREGQARIEVPGCALRPRAFACQACDKSYIGRGGLARHFKLNPGHGPPQPEALLPREAAGKAGLASARGGLQDGPSVEAEEAVGSEAADGSYSALLGTGRHTGPARGCAAAPAEPRAATPQPSSAARSRAGLQEFLHQCDRQDLVELALPELAQAVTVYEFLLMKVEKDHLARPFFPAVYKEFEELHKMVKKMYQEYLHSSGPCSQEPLEINNNEVAASLGITEEFPWKKETRTDGVPHACSCREEGSAEPEAAGPRKRESETAEAGPASAKRSRRAALPKEPTESSADSGGQRKPAGGAPAASEGIAQVSGHACHRPEDGHATLASDQDPGAPQVGRQLEAPAVSTARSASADSMPSHQDIAGPGLHAQPGQPRMPALEPTAAFPTESARGCPSGLEAGRSPGDQGLCSSVMSEGGVASLLPGGSGHTEAGKLGQVPGSPVRDQHSSPREALCAGTVAPPPEGVLSVRVVPMHCAYGTAPQPSTEGGLGSHVGDLDQVSHRTGTHAHQRELESIVAVGEAVVFEITNGCHELLSQGQEQIFIQTSDGLLLPHAGSVVSGEDIVILTEAEGPVLQTGPAAGLL
ncbi:zinc finger protein 839 [Pteronotus mesoamericanus]|uniref:zinc finger protein 839 n=1 Tax=Pteronotus mesoamericanus TaxID=1884717 RepID=UPI0023ECE1C3|nr:zinc finger protein 839 [Pteronotus parnellii mesoamericanus]